MSLSFLKSIKGCFKDKSSKLKPDSVEQYKNSLVSYIKNDGVIIFGDEGDDYEIEDGVLSLDISMIDYFEKEGVFTERECDLLMDAHFEDNLMDSSDSQSKSYLDHKFSLEESLQDFCASVMNKTEEEVLKEKDDFNIRKQAAYLEYYQEAEDKMAAKSEELSQECALVNEGLADDRKKVRSQFKNLNKM